MPRMPVPSLRNLTRAATSRSRSRPKPRANENDNVRDEKKSDTLEEEERAFKATDPELQAEAELSEHIPEAKDDAEALPAPREESHPHHFVPLRMGGRGGTHVPSEGSFDLLDEIGGLAGIEKMTGTFYNNAFKDATLDKLIRSHDDPHAKRFALWIYQKMSGDSVWDAERRHRPYEPVRIAGGRTTVVHDRSSAHAAAWHSPKRPARDVGRRFKLDDCRIWMRLHLWALREQVADRSPAFADYYVRFIGHFISVYERSAPPFARDSYRWSADPENIRRYIENGRRMDDVIGVPLGRAMRQIPEDEADDPIWPYLGVP